MKLRKIINDYTNWVVAVRLVHAGYLLDQFEAFTMIQQLQAHVRIWIGEDILELKL